jgi:polar amino acid transport system substrate-binding protein
MRTVSGVTALALVAAFAAACSSGSSATPSPSAASAAPSAFAAPSEAASPSPTADACAPENLKTLTAGTLTIGADNPSYPPFFEPSSPNPTPWELGDPTNGQGFEGAFGAALAKEMGFEGKTQWVQTPFNNAIAPGPKDFDIYITQVSYSADRAQAVDLSDGYYNVSQSIVGLKDNAIAKVTTVSGLKDFQFGAQVGTTSLANIQAAVAPSKEPKVYDTNDAAVEALKNGQIDGLAVDLPTAFYVTAAQVDNSVIVGQFAPTANAEHYSVALDKGSSITPCVNAAIARMTASGALAQLTQEWLADKANAPVFQP